jgi:TonB family protein
MRAFSLIRAVSGAISAIFAAILLAGASSAVAAKEREPVVLEPSSPWNLNYGDDSCRLIRSFGEGKDAHVMFFEVVGPSMQFGLTLAGPQMRHFRSERHTPLQFGDSLPGHITEPQVGDLKSIGPAVIYGSIGLVPEAEDGSDDEAQPDPIIAPSIELGTLPQINLDEAGQANFVQLSQRNRPVRFETGNLMEPFKALNICAGHLLETWGLDLEEHKTRIKAPEFANEDKVIWRLKRDYPDMALVRGQQAYFKMRLLIDEKGRVSNCFLFNQTEASSLDSPACKYMEKAEFEPALDSNGEPMESYYLNTILYAIN